MIDYLKDTLLTTAGAIWLAVTGVASVIGFTVTEATLSLSMRAAVIAVVACVVGIVVVLVRGFALYQEGSRPVPVRLVEKGRHHRHGRLMIVLDRSSWIKFNQILALVDSSADLAYPICLLRVSGFTTRLYPQCIVIHSLTNQEIEPYLLDQSRWRSLTASSAILSEYLESIQ